MPRPSVRCRGLAEEDHSQGWRIAPSFWRRDRRERPNGRVSRSPLGAPWGILTPLSRWRGLLARFMPVAILASNALAKIGRTWAVRPVPVTRWHHWGRTSRRRSGSGTGRALPGRRPTRRAASGESAVRAGMGGRGLSHPQELPLHQRREPPSPGRDRGLRAAGVTNGQSDGGALEPFH